MRQAVVLVAGEEGPRTMLVEIHVDYDDDHPGRLRERLVVAGISIDAESLVTRDDRGIQRLLRISAPDRKTWLRARELLVATPGLTIMAEEPA